jgi:large subunit ribosomal protein L11
MFFKACVIEIFLRSQLAESGPPLGTVLGNLGVNTVKFCKEFNDFTAELPSYFFLKVKINILEDRSFSFFIFLPTVGFFLSLLKFTRIVNYSGENFLEKCVSLKEVVQLALLKFPFLHISESFPIICGTVNSAGLLIV